MTTQEELQKCFKCGMCRAVCPVLAEELVETSSPRAKIALCEAVLAGELSLTESVLQTLRRCTGCRSCSLNCTGGADPRSVAAKAYSTHAVDERDLACESPVGQLLLGIISDPTKQLGPFKDQSHPGELRVAYFIGCVEASRLGHVPENVLRTARRLGLSVVVPLEQMCCGWPHILVGDMKSAKELARQNKRTFEAYDVVLTSCVHCQSMLTEDYPAMLGVDELAPKVEHVLAFVEAQGVLGQVRFRRQVDQALYSHACRMGRGRIRNTSHLDLLRERLGDSLIETVSDQCCGAPLELSSPVTAQKMLDRKVAGIEDSGCGAVLSDCPFCVLALGSSLSMPVKHVLEEVGV